MMTYFGQRKEIVVRQKRDGKLVPLLDGGKPVKRTVASRVTRLTREAIGGRFGCYKAKKLVVALVDGDVILVWPQGTRQKLAIAAKDLYAHLCWRKASAEQLERARQCKAGLERKRRRERDRRAEERLARVLPE